MFVFGKLLPFVPAVHPEESTVSTRVASFEFASDDTFSDPSTCTINWAASTVTYPGVATVAFDKVDEVVTAINQFATQDLADGVTDTEKQIPGGGPTCKYVAGTTPTISPGSAPFAVPKAQSLAAGLQEFVLDEA